MSQLLVNISLSFVVMLVIALSFSIIYSVERFFHFAHAVFITIGAYLVYAGKVSFGWSMWVAIPMSIIIGAFLMMAVDKLIYARLQRFRVAGWQIMIASLGLYVVIQNIVSLVWGDSYLSFRTWEVKTGHELLGAYITNVQIITLITCWALLALVWLFREKTNIGKQIKAVSSNDEMSGILGLNKNRAIMWSVAIGTALAACAGILIAADTDMTPTMGFNWLLYAVVAMIIGGMGKMRYLLLGTLLLATAQHLAAYYLDSKWMNATAYIILIVFLFFRPTGFSGKQLKKSSI